MRELDISRSFEIGDGASELEESEVDPGREIHAFEGLFEKFILLFAESTVFFNIFLGNLRIAGFLCSFESLRTENACRFNLFLDIDGGPSFIRPISEILHLDPRHPNKEVDAIEDGSRELRAIAINL